MQQLWLYKYKLLTKQCPTSKIVIPILTFCDPFKKLSTNKVTIARYNAIYSKINQKNLLQDNSLVSIWKLSRFDNTFKTFAYQFTQNILYSNAHMLINCPVVYRLREKFIVNLNLTRRIRILPKWPCVDRLTPPHQNVFLLIPFLWCSTSFSTKKRNTPNIKIQFDCFIREITNYLPLMYST